MPRYKYRILDPSGNVTALVIGLVHDADVRCCIQDAILEKHKNVEQVGFVCEDTSAPQLFMTGGEFCGNATRAAAWHYLEGKPGELSLWVSGVDAEVRAGVSANLDAWAAVPVRIDIKKVRRLGEGIFFVKMEGIAHMVLAERQAKEYLRRLDADSLEDKERLKWYAKALLERYSLFDRDACGVMFCENVLDMVKIHPCLFINTAGTAYYEMACGSGSIAVALVAAYLRGSAVNLPILQPSDKIIHTSIEFCDGEACGARISGGVADSGEVLEVEADAQC